MSPDSSSILSQNSMSSSLVANDGGPARPSSSSMAPRPMSITSGDDQKLSSMGGAGNSAELKLSISIVSALAGPSWRLALVVAALSPDDTAAMDSVAVVTPLLTLLDSPGDAAVNASLVSAAAGLLLLRAFCCFGRSPAAASASASSSRRFLM
ncbi:unnamed protein product [Urochloa humidicola]